MARNRGSVSAEIRIDTRQSQRNVADLGRRVAESQRSMQLFDQGTQRLTNSLTRATTTTRQHTTALMAQGRQWSALNQVATRAQSLMNSTTNVVGRLTERIRNQTRELQRNTEARRRNAQTGLTTGGAGGALAAPGVGVLGAGAVAGGLGRFLGPAALLGGGGLLGLGLISRPADLYAQTRLAQFRFGFGGGFEGFSNARRVTSAARLTNIDENRALRTIGATTTAIQGRFRSGAEALARYQEQLAAAGSRLNIGNLAGQNTTQQFTSIARDLRRLLRDRGATDFFSAAGALGLTAEQATLIQQLDQEGSLNAFLNELNNGTTITRNAYDGLDRLGSQTGEVAQQMEDLQLALGNLVGRSGLLTGLANTIRAISDPLSARSARTGGGFALGAVAGGGIGLGVARLGGLLPGPLGAVARFGAPTFGAITGGLAGANVTGGPSGGGTTVNADNITVIADDPTQFGDELNRAFAIPISSLGA